jgi:hypothetical protein
MPHAPRRTRRHAVLAAVLAALLALAFAPAASASQPDRGAQQRGASEAGEQAGRPEAPGRSGDASAQAPGSSSQAPGRTGDAPGTSGQAPGSSSEAPGRTGDAPGTSGQAPGRTGDAPGTRAQAPGRSGSGAGSAPAAGGERGGRVHDADRTPADPPGNRGTVKIDGPAFDEHTRNEPHPGCEFRVQFFGFADSYADVTFAAHAPTGSGVLLGPDRVHFPDGAKLRQGNELAGVSPTYDLVPLFEAAGITPHARQGYHVKLTVHSENEHGSNVKHKVFWLRCSRSAAQAPAAGGTDGTGEDRDETDDTAAGDSVEEGDVLGSVEERDPTVGAPVAEGNVGGTEVLAGGLSAAGSATGTVAAVTVSTSGSPAAPRALAATGLGIGLLALLSLAGIAGGTALLRRRPRTTQD